ncbi:MAG: ATP synthase F0 subunit B [Terriglobia bacterium]
MSDAFRLVGLLFVRSAPTVIFVIILLAILDRLFFRPIAEVMKKRAENTVGALARAREQVNEAEAKSRQYESALQAARAEVFKQRQTEHQKALEEQDRAMHAAREHSQDLVRKAQTALAGEVAFARRQLLASGQALAQEIAEKILGAPHAGEGRPL